MNALKNDRHDVLTRRQALRRFALLSAIVLAPAVVGSTGCQTMKDVFSSKPKKKESKTIDDVLSEKRPEW